MVRDKKRTSTPLIKLQEEHLEHNWTFGTAVGLMCGCILSCILINGKQTIEYPDFKPGEKVRVRVINGGASTSFG
jgi:hypothetical protein